MELRICMAPKIMSVAPPAVPTASLTVGWFATLRSPRANSMTRVNSIMVWAIENIMPLLLPVLMPWVIVTKNNGPGARAPEVVRIMTVTARLSGSMNLGALGGYNEFLVCSLLFGVFVLNRNTKTFTIY